ncbi:MAG: AAA family ATPase [Actinobacteria bacterium]|nr:AAA family ATPase [Actinomycetota bacterium]
MTRVVPGAPGRERPRPPLVGRKRELAILADAFEEVANRRICRLVNVRGSAGVGKSRLAEEFLGGVPAEAVVLRGRCLPYGEGITFWPIAEIVRQASGIHEGQSSDQVRGRIEALVGEDQHGKTIAERMAQLVGIAQAEADAQETFWAVRRFLEALARREPLVILIDDLQWAEPTLLDLLEDLVARMTAVSVLMLCLARPELSETRQGWGEGERSSSIHLEALDADECRELLRNILGTAIASDVEDRIVRAADGNPLFLEETISLLVETGSLLRSDGGWVSATDAMTMPLLPSVQAVLSARLDALSPQERAVISRASVIGEVFYWGAVAALCPVDLRRAVGGHLQRLAKKQLITPSESDFATEDAFRFRHILIRDVAYQAVPKATRAELHERVAAWLEEAAGDRIPEFEEILGYHLEGAYRMRVDLGPADTATSLAARASRLLSSAGRRAIDRGDIGAARNLLARASDLCPAGDRDALAIRLSLARVLRAAGEYPEADRVLSNLVNAARDVGDRAIECRARLQRAWVTSSTSDISFDEVKEVVDQAIDIFGELRDERGLAECWHLLAWMHFNGGRTVEAQKADQLAATYFRKVGDAVEEMWALANEAYYAASGPTPVEEAITKCREVLDHVKDRPAQEANVSGDLGFLEAMRGNADAARAATDHARSIRRELGASLELATMTQFAGHIEWFAGDIVAEERERRAGYEAFQRMGATAYTATAAAWLARPLVDLGRDEEAFRLTVESEELAAEDDITAQIPWRQVRATVLARRGEVEEAERLAREAITIAESTDGLLDQGDSYMALATVLRLAALPTEATEAARAAVERFERKGNVVSAARARAFLEDVERKSQSST